MMHWTRTVVLGAAVALALSMASSLARGESPDERFFHAYYLEHAEGDLAGAVELYREVAGARGTTAELRSRAAARLASCEEDLVSSDLARLMPPDALVYVELNRPGHQLSALLDQLGLMGAVTGSNQEGPRLSISPALINGVLGIRGVAAALTGIDPIKQMPSGVVILHPGDMDVIRGLIETGLPVGAKALKPIRDYPTYDIEGKAVVTLTSRLVIAATHRHLIEDVVRRLKGENTDSLATNEELADALSNRQDALLYFCVHTKPIMPMLNAMLSANGAGNRRLAMAKALVDPQSLKSIVGRIGVGDNSLFLDLSLNLQDGHRNLVYNFLRTPAIQEDLLAGIPAGAAAFLVGALNEAPSRFPSTSSTAGDGLPIVTALDFGREIFANIIGFSVFALPPDGEAQARHDGPPMPDVAAAITVNDPTHSEGLWRQMLGIASLAAGAPTMDGKPTEIDGVKVHRYRFPEGVSVNFATVDNRILIATTPSAMARSIAAVRTGRSVLNDDAFAGGLAGIDANTTKALFLHADRCFQIGKQFMSDRDLAKAEPFIDALAHTVLSVALNHSAQTLHVSGRISGIPQVGDLVAQRIAAERSRGQLQHRLSQAKQRRSWGEAMAVVNEMSEANPGDVGLQTNAFELLAVEMKDDQAARAKAEQIADLLADNAMGLNNFAWALLTEKQYDGQYDDLALRFAERSNKVSDYGDWAYLDTLALALFRAGNVAGAVELQRKAIERCPKSRLGNLERSLAEYEKAARVSETPPTATAKIAATP